MSRAQLTSTVEQNTGGAVSPYVAGKNVISNGGMDIWQRGTSFSVVAFDYRYTADRWLTFNGAACTISQETSTVPSGSQYALKLTGGASTSNYEMWQVIETANAIGLAGQTATLSVYATGTTSSTCTVTLDYSTGTDTGSAGSWTAISPASSVTSLTSGTFTRISTTVSVPSTAKSLRVRITTNYLTTGQFQIYGKAQLEIGSVATPFSRAGGTLSGELAACQRYYERRTAQGANYGMGMSGRWTSTTSGSTAVTFASPKRTNPSASYSGLNASNGSTNIAITSINGPYGSGQSNAIIGADVGFNVAGSGTAGYAAMISDSGAGTGYIEFSAEL